MSEPGDMVERVARADEITQQILDVWFNRVKIAAIIETALAASGDMVERVEPVAWMYTLEGDPYSPYLHRRRQSVYACPPHIETPLYAAPPTALAASGADRMREALEEIKDLGSDGEHSGDRHARCRAIARRGLGEPQ